MARRRGIEIRINGYGRVDAAVHQIKDLILRGLAAGPVIVWLGRPARSLSQNRKLWPMLTDVSKQRQLVVNGHAVWAQPEDWKDVFTASLKREQRVALGIDGAPVFLGVRTSKMNKRDFSDLIELIYAYGAEKQVCWSEKSISHFEEYRQENGVTQ